MHEPTNTVHTGTQPAASCPGSHNQTCRANALSENNWNSTKQMDSGTPALQIDKTNINVHADEIKM
jgi:hypothetical protein